MAGRKRVAGLVRPSKGGRITIPIDLREQLGIDEHTVLELSVNGDELRLRPVRSHAGSDWLKELYDELAPIRDGMRDLSEDEVNALIDEAVAEVRRSRA
jgi:AbrB family looped-hinge helix DNA binding protein